MQNKATEVFNTNIAKGGSSRKDANEETSKKDDSAPEGKNTANKEKAENVSHPTAA